MGRWLAVLAAFLLIVVILAVAVRASGPDDETAGGSGSDAATGADRQDQGLGADGSGAEGSGGDGSDGAGGIPFQPDSLALSDDAVWVTDYSCGVLVRIDRATATVAGSIDLGGSTSGVTIADGSVWVGNRDQTRVVRVDPDTITIEDTVAVPGVALGLGSEDDEVWAVGAETGEVYRIDALTGALIDTAPVGTNPHHVDLEAGVAWVANNGDGTVSRITPTAPSGPATVDTFPVGAGALHVVAAEGSAWVTDGIDGTVHRLNAATGAVEAVIGVGFFPHALAYADGFLWVGTEGGELWRITPATNEAVRVESATFSSIDMAVDGDELWVADSYGGTVVHFDVSTQQVATVVDLGEFGDCDTFRQEAVTPPPPSAA